MTTKIIPISDLRRHVSEALAAVREEGDVVYITQHGRPTAVLVDFEQYEAMLAQLEDLADLADQAEITNTARQPERGHTEFLAEVGRDSW